jgi:hypothetical protein
MHLYVPLIIFLLFSGLECLKTVPASPTDATLNIMDPRWHPHGLDGNTDYVHHYVEHQEGWPGSNCSYDTAAHPWMSNSAYAAPPEQHNTVLGPSNPPHLTRRSDSAAYYSALSNSRSGSLDC